MLPIICLYPQSGSHNPGPTITSHNKRPQFLSVKMETLSGDWLLFVIIMSAFMFLFCLTALTKKVCATGCCVDCETSQVRLERLSRDQAQQIRVLQLELHRLRVLQNAGSGSQFLAENDLPKYEEIFPEGSAADDRVVQIFVVHHEGQQQQHLHQQQQQQQITLARDQYYKNMFAMT